MTKRQFIQRAEQVLKSLENSRDTKMSDRLDPCHDRIIELADLIHSLWDNVNEQETTETDEQG